jgi:hypothetical protein
MPPMMERHKKNTSWYCAPRDSITWKVEVILIPTQQTFSFTLSEDEENILDYVTKQISLQAQGPETEEGDNRRIDDEDAKYELFIKRPSAANNPKYFRLSPTESLRKALRGLNVIEHPTIYCVPNEENLLKAFPTGTDKIEEQPTNQPTTGALPASPMTS